MKNNRVSLSIMLRTATLLIVCCLVPQTTGQGGGGGVVIENCTQIQPQESNITVMVVKKGAVPAVNTAPGTYNMQPMTNFPGGVLMFVDQLEGNIYRYKKRKVDTIFNASDYDFAGTPIEGMNLQYQLHPREPFSISGTGYAIQSVARGHKRDEIYVVFTSDVVPDGLTVDFSMPGDNYSAYESLFLDTNPYTFAPLVYKIFVKFDYDEDAGELSNPQPFLVLEQQNNLGHQGGAILTVRGKGNRLLWSEGDCIVFGMNGLEGSQDPDVHCGNILIINTETGETDVAAIGVRNSQQMTLEDDGNIVFMDIGGVTAEEVNLIPLDDLLDTSKIENFGWGIPPGDASGEGREGTFKVETGRPYGDGPFCTRDQTVEELNDPSYTKPWLQYGRETAGLFGIISHVVSSRSFDKIKVATSEFNSGTLFAALDDYDPDYVAGAYAINLVDKQGNPLETGFNSLTPDGGRGDSRLFKFPNGVAGVFIERTGEFFQLFELNTSDGCDPFGEVSLVLWNADNDTVIRPLDDGVIDLCEYEGISLSIEALPICKLRVWFALTDLATGEEVLTNYEGFPPFTLGMNNPEDVFPVAQLGNPGSYLLTVNPAPGKPVQFPLEVLACAE